VLRTKIRAYPDHFSLTFCLSVQSPEMFRRKKLRGGLCFLLSHLPALSRLFHQRYFIRLRPFFAGV
jgi:hypothetical protein